MSKTIVPPRRLESRVFVTLLLVLMLTGGCLRVTRLERVYAKLREDQTMYELYRITACSRIPMT